MESSKIKSSVTVNKGQQTGEFLLTVTSAINTILEMNTQIAFAVLAVYQADVTIHTARFRIVG